MQWPARVRAWLLELPDWVSDTGLAVLLLGIELEAKNVDQPPYAGWSTPATIVTLLLGTLSLAFRRRAPLLVFAIAVSPAIATVVTGFPIGDLSLAIALLTVASRCPRRHSLPALAFLVMVKLVAAIIHPHLLPWVPVSLFGHGVVWILGDQQRVQRALRRELEHRAELLEQDRERKAALAVADERARIARDLHDVVTHSVSVMVLHTAAARRTISRDSTRAEQILAQVEAVGRQSLAELRQLLGVLREHGQGVELTPQPQLAYLDELVNTFREAGMPVEVRIAGEPRPLKPVVDLCAYRIVQEALTNVVKHANATEVQLNLHYHTNKLRIEIVDNGRGANAASSSFDGSGHGLIGMRERATLAGGHLLADLHPDGVGFCVAAVLPLESDA
ncbi:MAG: sensor histidine kinase [Pseudonocardia sp.]|nr:sensor histidine kinase [Pseudonocardia sp.]